MTYEINFEGFVNIFDGEARRLPTDEELEQHLDEVMDQLLSLRAQDAAIGATGADGSVQISATVDAPDLSTAIVLGNGLIRAAIHAAGGHTPGWSITLCSATASEQASEDRPDQASHLLTHN